MDIQKRKFIVIFSECWNFLTVIFALWKHSKYLSIEVTKPRAIKFLGACLNNASNVETFCAFDLEIC